MSTQVRITNPDHVAIMLFIRETNISLQFAQVFPSQIQSDTLGKYVFDLEVDAILFKLRFA